MIDEIEECEEIKEVEKVSTLEIKQNSFKQDVKVHNPPSLKTLAYQTVKNIRFYFFSCMAWSFLKKSKSIIK